jgi:hypothetical protein
MYKDTVSCPEGCDSVITVNLTILHSPSKTINVTACGSYLSPSGKYVWTNSGTYFDTIPNEIGCDSIIIVNLLTNTVDTSVIITNATITSNATASTYQWLDCNNSFAPIDGETSKSFSPITDGIYAIKVTTDDCTDTSSCYSIITLSVIENNFENNILFYPNPSSGIFTVDMGDTYTEVELIITDNIGRVIDKSIQKQCRLLFLEINELGGVYFLKLKTENKIAIIKLIKN